MIDGWRLMLTVIQFGVCNLISMLVFTICALLFTLEKPDDISAGSLSGKHGLNECKFQWL